MTHEELQDISGRAFMPRDVPSSAVLLKASGLPQVRLGQPAVQALLGEGVLPVPRVVEVLVATRAAPALYTIPDHWRFEDPATGAEVLLIVETVNMWGGALTSEAMEAAPHSHRGYAQTFSAGTDPGPVLTIPSLQMRVRQRPWDQAPFGPPSPVEITEGPRF
jgi:hypothetical protein